VTDAAGATSKQEWTLQISSSDTQTSSSSSNSIGAISGKFTFPPEKTVFGGEINRIVWELSGEPNRLVLVYQPENTQQLNLLAELPSNARSFVWDVSNISNGRYQLFLQAKSPDGKLMPLATLKDIQVDNPATGEVGSKTLVLNVQPIPETAVTNLRPEITGELVAAAGQKIDPATLVLEVDGLIRTNWCKQTADNKFSCSPAIDLAPGLHKVRIGIQTTSKTLAVKEWTFTTVKPAEGIGSGFSLNLGGIFSGVASWNWPLIILICIVSMLLLVLPTAAFLIWRRAQQEQQDVTAVQYTIGEENLEPAINEGSFYVIPTAAPAKPESKPAETKPEPKPEAKPKASGSVEDLDPTKFNSYEEYLKAVNAKLSATEPVYVMAPATTTQVEENYITTPDYMAEINKQEEQKAKEAEKAKEKEAEKSKPPEPKPETKPEPKPEEKKAGSSNDMPDWLRPV
jgi:hypothetical protein